MNITASQKNIGVQGNLSWQAPPKAPNPKCYLAVSLVHIPSRHPGPRANSNPNLMLPPPTHTHTYTHAGLQGGRGGQTSLSVVDFLDQQRTSLNPNPNPHPKRNSNTTLSSPPPYAHTHTFTHTPTHTHTLGVQGDRAGQTPLSVVDFLDQQWTHLREDGRGP